MSMISPRLSQAHCQVAQADTRPKPTKELVLPTHKESADNKERNANRVDGSTSYR